MTQNRVNATILKNLAHSLPMIQLKREFNYYFSSQYFAVVYLHVFPLNFDIDRCRKHTFTLNWLIRMSTYSNSLFELNLILSLQWWQSTVFFPSCNSHKKSTHLIRLLYFFQLLFLLLFLHQFFVVSFCCNASTIAVFVLFFHSFVFVNDNTVR